MIKNVVDIYGTVSRIDASKQTVYTYCNRKKEIVYNAPVVDENDDFIGCYTNYKERGTVDSIEDRLTVWNNTILFVYADYVGFNADENDPNGEKYNKLVDYVKENSEKFFTKEGDFRKKFLISVEEIRAILKK